MNKVTVYYRRLLFRMMKRSENDESMHWCVNCWWYYRRAFHQHVVNKQTVGLYKKINKNTINIKRRIARTTIIFISALKRMNIINNYVTCNNFITCIYGLCYRKHDLYCRHVWNRSRYQM